MTTSRSGKIGMKNSNWYRVYDEAFPDGTLEIQLNKYQDEHQNSEFEDPEDYSTIEIDDTAFEELSAICNEFRINYHEE